MWKNYNFIIMGEQMLVSAVQFLEIHYLHTIGEKSTKQDKCDFLIYEKKKKEQDCHLLSECVLQH
jgi:hypothetical protein